MLGQVIVSWCHRALALLFGAGPEWVHLNQNEKVTNSIAGELVGDFMFWPTGKHRFAGSSNRLTTTALPEATSNRSARATAMTFGLYTGTVVDTTSTVTALKSWRGFCEG